MAAKRPHRNRSKPPAARRAKQAATPAENRAGGDAMTLRARKLPDEDAWEFVPARCAKERAEDLDEVRAMLDAGELAVARDECRWLLEGCSECLEAHRILGEIALEEGDMALARGHFGFAYRLGITALKRAATQGPLPYRRKANQPFFEAAKGLAWCLLQLGKPEMAAEVVAVCTTCDPSDPLQMRGLLADQTAE